VYDGPDYPLSPDRNFKEISALARLRQVATLCGTVERDGAQTEPPAGVHFKRHIRPYNTFGLTGSGTIRVIAMPLRIRQTRRFLPLMIYGVSAKKFVHDLYQETNDDDVYNGAAALGFYLTLAIFPAIIAMMNVIPYLPIARVDEAIMDLLGQALPDEASVLVAGVVDQVLSEQRGGLLSFSLLATLWAASTGMYAIMQHLNIAYDVKERRSFIRARATALVLSLLFGALVLGAFSLIVLGGIVQDWIGNQFGFTSALLAFFAVFRWVIIVLALLLAFAIVYHHAPNVERSFKLVTPGSIFAVAMLIFTSLVFSFYTKNFADYNAAYGSIGAVVILMLWLYMAGLVTLVGSEINALLEHYRAESKLKAEKLARDGRHGGPGANSAQ
jgi:membrane protein